MILEVFLTALKYVIFGIIFLLPAVPVVPLNNLDGVFQILSIADLVFNVRMFAVCLVTVIVVLNIELIWSVIMWVVRKIPGVN